MKKKPKEEPHPALDLRNIGIPEPLHNVTPKAVLEGIIAPRLEEIYSYIGEELEKSGYMKQIPSGIVVTGGGSLTIGMPEMGRKTLGLPIRVGTPEKATGLVDEIMDPQFAATIGLIFYGKNHIIEDQQGGVKDFNKIFKNFSFSLSPGKLKDLLKQFLP
jgi:cell division protein FtsA